MPNLLNRKFQFGFLNDAQDPVDLAANEAVTVLGLDADKLALGSLQSSDYYDATDTGKDWTGDTTEVVLNGRKFSLQSNVLKFEETPGGVKTSVNDGSHPAIPASPVVGATDFVPFNPDTVLLSDASASVIFGLTANNYYEGKPGITLHVEIDETSPGVFVWYMADSEGNLLSGDFGISTTPQDTGYGNVTVAWSAAVTGVDGAYAETDVEGTELADGDYTYVMTSVMKDGVLSIDPDEDIQSAPSDPTVLNLDNFDPAGDRKADYVPQITFPVVFPVYTAELWLFRKGPNDTEFVRLARYDKTNITTDLGEVIASNVYTDTTRVSSITKLTLLKTEDDEIFPTIDAAIGNTQGFNKIFEKSNRIWAVPTDRQDLLLYSREGDWWGWNRANSFSFEGDITDLVVVRDPTTVGGTFTTVVGTTNGLYHITGVGTESDPFVSVRALSDIYVEANSMVNANGTVMFVTRSSDAGYDTGSYGQKVYEYDLQSVVEVSQRVKESAPIAATGVSYAKMAGSDKYIFKKPSSALIMVYHRDAKNWVTTQEAVETAGLWFWTSKDFTPEILQRFKIDYARMVKIDYVGEVKLKFDVYAGDGQVLSSVTMNLPTAATRSQFQQRLPSLQARKWRFSLEAVASGAILYDFYFVR